jgi:diguanylate cyclase
MTRLLTRQTLEDALVSVPGETTLSLALLDLDRFKEVNDTYGHGAGDAVLRRLETLLTGSVPEGALVARLGGDEYAVALLETPAEGALILMEEIRAHFSSRPPAPEVPHAVALSVGVASRPPHASTVPELFRAADEALYRAKSEGRSRVAIYQETRMTLKSNYYPKAALERLAKLSVALNRTEASLLREALDDLLIKWEAEL